MTTGFIIYTLRSSRVTSTSCSEDINQHGGRSSGPAAGAAAGSSLQAESHTFISNVWCVCVCVCGCVCDVLTHGSRVTLCSVQRLFCFHSLNISAHFTVTEIQHFLQIFHSKSLPVSNYIHLPNYSSVLRYLYFTLVFLFSATLYFYFTTFIRII